MTRVAVFVAALALVFVVAFGVGRAFDNGSGSKPGPTTTPSSADTSPGGHDHSTDHLGGK